jgi:hypothetical protein
MLYGLGAIVLLLVAPRWKTAVPGARWAGRYGYEWFLLHGLSLHVARLAGGDDVWITGFLGVLIAAPSAMILGEVLSRGARVLRGRGSASRPSAPQTDVTVGRGGAGESVASADVGWVVPLAPESGG